jgi:hypothetical protein
LKGRDRDGASQRLACRKDFSSLASEERCPSKKSGRRPARASIAAHSQHLQGPSHFVTCFPQSQPAFAGDQAGELFALRFERRARPVKNLTPFVAVRSVTELARRRHRRLDILARRGRHPPGFRAIMRASNDDDAAAAGGFSGDQLETFMVMSRCM